jgi:DNA-binding transcriptional regulator PaaX
MNIEEIVRGIVRDELTRQQPESLQPLAKFCKEQGISRVSLWRLEKSGRIQIIRIGKRCFINPQQFHVR